jgi:hypothetical protein
MAQQLAAAEARASDAEAAASAARAAAEAAERQQALAAEASEKAAGVAAADEEKPVMHVAPPAAGVDIAGALVRAFDADGDGKLTFGDVRTILDKTLGGLFAPVLAPRPEPVPISKALTSLTSLSPIASVSDEPALPTVFAAARISFALFEWEKTDFDQLERRVIEGQNLQNPTSLKAVIAAARVRKVFAAARSSSARFVWDDSDFNQLERSVYQALGMPAPAPPVAGWFAREVKPSPKTVRGQLSQRLFGGYPEATVRAAMLDSVAEEEAPAAVEEEHAPEESAESADAVQLVAASITDVSSCTGGVDSMSATALVEAAPATTAFAPATEPPAVGTATRPSTALVVASYASAALTAATASFRGLRQTPRALEGKSARGSSFQVQVRLKPTLSG